jgi:hypothetical protein
MILLMEIVVVEVNTTSYFGSYHLFWLVVKGFDCFLFSFYFFLSWSAVLEVWVCRKKKFSHLNSLNVQLAAGFMWFAPYHNTGGTSVDSECLFSLLFSFISLFRFVQNELTTFICFCFLFLFSVFYHTQFFVLDLFFFLKWDFSFWGESARTIL